MPGWADMSIAEHQQLYKFEAIQSISEFSAVDGGVPSFMLSNLGPFTWAVVIMHFAAQTEYNADVFRWDIADLFELMGVSGLVMIGIFELDPYNAPMRSFHNIGAATGIGTVVGMIIQAWSLSKNESVLRLVLKCAIAAIGLMFMVMWVCSNNILYDCMSMIIKIAFIALECVEDNSGLPKMAKGKV